MRKLLLLLLILALGLFLGLPGAVGWGLANQGPGLVQNLDTSLGQYEIRAGPIDSGWFSSQVVLDVRRSDGRPIFSYPLALRHGPWAGRPAWLAGKGPLTAPDGEPLGRLAWSLRLDTGLDASLILEEAAGATGQAQLTLASGYRQGRLTVPSWDASSVAGLSGTLDFDTAAGLARVDAAIAEVRTPTFRSDRVAVDGAFAWTTPWLDLDVEYLAESHAAGQLGGTLAPFALRLNLTHLDQRVLDQALRLRDSASLLGLLPALLDGQPRLERWSLEGAHPLGEVAISANLSLTSPPPAGFLSSADRLISVLDGSGEHQIDPPLLRDILDRVLAFNGIAEGERPARVEATMELLEDSGFLKPLDGGKVGGEVSLRNGELRFNGQLNRRWQTGAPPASP